MDIDKFYVVLFGKKVHGLLLIPVFLASVLTVIISFSKLGDHNIIFGFVMAGIPILVYSYVEEIFGFFNVSTKNIRKLSFTACFMALGLYFLIFSWNLLNNAIMAVIYYLYCRLMFDLQKEEN